MENVGTAEQRSSVNFLCVEGNIGQKQHFSVFDIFEVLYFDLVGEELVKSPVEAVLDEVFDRTEVGDSIHDCSQQVPKNHRQTISNYYFCNSNISAKAITNMFAFNIMKLLMIGWMIIVLLLLMN